MEVQPCPFRDTRLNSEARREAKERYQRQVAQWQAKGKMLGPSSSHVRPPSLPGKSTKSSTGSGKGSVKGSTKSGVCGKSEPMSGKGPDKPGLYDP